MERDVISEKVLMEIDWEAGHRYAFESEANCIKRAAYAEGAKSRYFKAYNSDPGVGWVALTVYEGAVKEIKRLKSLIPEREAK